MPPFGHTTHLRVFIDPNLLQRPEVRAAAGFWKDVLGIEPHESVEAAGGAVVDSPGIGVDRMPWVPSRPGRFTFVT